jgi:gliding motility-associated-like protein
MEGGLYMEEVAIMDRWGTVVHRMNGLELSQYQGWDGTLRGELMPVGVYVYTVRLRNGRGEHFQFAGDIMLTR